MSLETITLADPDSGATAKVLVGFGFNCYSFCPVVAGRPFEVLWSAPDFALGGSRPSHSGIPLLFPFAGRLRGSHLTYGKHTFALGSDDGRGNAIHGFVLNRAWRVVEHGPNRLAGEFQASIDEPGLIRRWPADFRLTVTYEVAGNGLACEVQVLNPGEGSLPFSLGLHPYFRVPLGGRGTGDDCRISVPVAEYWELADLLPTGRRLPADGPRHLARGLRFGESQWDDVFTGLTSAQGVCRATIEDPHNGRTLELTFDDQFRHSVVYVPPHREAICIEPYTCVPDAFNLSASGIETGLRVLATGESFTARAAIGLK